MVHAEHLDAVKNKMKHFLSKIYALAGFIAHGKNSLIALCGQVQTVHFLPLLFL